jgi:hypothetical protein
MMTFAAPAEWRDNGARIRAGVNEIDHMSAGPVRRTSVQSRGGRSPPELRHFNAAEANLNKPIMARQDAFPDQSSRSFTSDALVMLPPASVAWWWRVAPHPH